MQAIGFIVYIVVGLFQLAAIMAGLESWWGLHWIIAAPIAFIVSYIPFVGAIVGMVGAMDRIKRSSSAISTLYMRPTSPLFF